MANRAISRKGGGQAWLNWILATTFVIWLFAIESGYGIVSDDIQLATHLTISQVGYAASVFAWTFAILQFFSGALLDRFGSRPLLSIAVALVTVGAFLYAGTTSFLTLALAQFVMALGAAFGFVGAGYVGGQWFVAARYGLMFGLVQTFVSLGSAITQPTLAALLNHADWRALLAGFGVFGVLLTVVFILFVRNPTLSPDDPRNSSAVEQPRVLKNLAACFTNPQVMLSALFAGASFGSMLAMGVVWGPRVHVAQGTSEELAALLTSCLWVGLAIGSPLINLLSDRVGSRKWPACAGLAVQLVATILFLYVPTNTALVSALIMFVIGLAASSQMLGFTIAGESVSPLQIGAAAAVVNGFCFIFAGLLDGLTGHLLAGSDLDLDSYQGAMWTMPLLLVIGLGCTVLLRDKPSEQPMTV